MIDQLLGILAETLEEEKLEIADYVLERKDDIELDERTREAAISYITNIELTNDHENDIYEAGLIKGFKTAIKVVEEYKRKHMQ